MSLRGVMPDCEVGVPGVVGRTRETGIQSGQSPKKWQKGGKRPSTQLRGSGRCEQHLLNLEKNGGKNNKGRGQKEQKRSKKKKKKKLNEPRKGKKSLLT